MKVILIFLMLFGCATAPVDPEPIHSDIPIFTDLAPIENETLILSHATSQQIKLAFNQAYFKSQNVWGFHVTWNGIYQGVYLVSDTLDLPTGNGMSLVLDYINREGMRMNKVVTHNLGSIK